MSELTQSSPINEFALLEGELDKLFAFQDKHLPKEKRAILIDELTKLDFPFGAVIAGIRSLMMDDLNSIKFPTIVAAIRSRIVPDEEVRARCEECSSGYIVMKDEQQRNFALACRCVTGEAKVRSQGLSRWNGESSQFSKGRLLVKA